MRIRPLSINQLFWIAGALLASVFLMKMMRRRQAKLRELLKEYMQTQLEWAQKRAKAAKLARQAAREKARQEAQFTKQMGEVGQVEVSKVQDMMDAEIFEDFSERAA